MSRSVPRVMLAALWLSLPGLLVACGDDDPTALPPGDGTGAKNGGKPAPIPRRDSGTNADPDSGLDEDSGMGSGGTTAPEPGMPSECQNLKATHVIGEDPSVAVIASSAEPEDFEITRAVATWEKDCKKPTIRVDLSDGSCPAGKGHQLSFWFEAAAIDTAAIFPGLNTVFPEPDNGGVKIRYTRPPRLTPSGVWGTCPGSVATLNFFGEPSTAAFSDLQVSRFSLELTPCDGRANANQIISGSFNLELQRGLREACPP